MTVTTTLTFYGRLYDSKDRPFCFVAAVSIFFLLFFRCLISEVAWPIGHILW